MAESAQPGVVEVWCDVPPSVAWTRYLERQRHDIHPTAGAVERDWADWTANAVPLGIGRTVRVDTSSPLDAASLAAMVSVSTAVQVNAN